ncbi:flagellin N-terminal helical domain-containing protein [Nitrospira sp. Kam-Ns4a]
MSLDINSNVASLIAQLNLSRNTQALSQSVQRLSSGLRVNSAADDPAALAISINLRAQISSLNQAIANANNGVSLLQVADSSAGTMSNLLSQMRALAVQASSGTLDSQSQSYLDNEFVALRSEIDRIAETTEFNGVKLLSGSQTVTLQIGFRSSANDQLSLSLTDLHTASLGISAVNISTAANAQSAIAALDTALNNVASAQATYGVYQNRLQATVSNLQVSTTNFQSADSVLRDADIAAETAKFTRNQVLVQAGTAVLAQANTLPQIALTLLR